MPEGWLGVLGKADDRFLTPNLSFLTSLGQERGVFGVLADFTSKEFLGTGVIFCPEMHNLLELPGVRNGE